MFILVRGKDKWAEKIEWLTKPYRNKRIKLTLKMKMKELNIRPKTITSWEENS